MSIQTPYWTEPTYLQTICGRLFAQNGCLYEGTQTPLVKLRFKPELPIHLASPPGFLSAYTLNTFKEMLCDLSRDPHGSATAFLQCRAPNAEKEIKDVIKQHFKDPPCLIEPRTLVQIDLTHAEDYMLAACRKDTRYRIKQSKKMDTSFRVEYNAQFWELYNHIAERNSFSNTYKYSTKDISQLISSSAIKAISVYHGQEYIGGSIIGAVNKERCDYILSAYTLNAPNAGRSVLWQSLLAAKSLGFENINLGGGVYEEDTLFDFKMSFGGQSAPFYTIKLVLDEALYRKAYNVVNSDIDLTGRFPPQA
ncbi:MAG: hypothetical protein KTR28_00610 [Micavibrio sp.]|nr:hypothetical protein [Micavibrio sp.]